MGDFGVLVVDDDEVIARVFQRVVSGTPGFFIVDVAPSAEHALRVLRRSVGVDLVLLDIGLPGADGTRLLQVIRRMRGPEVIAVTAMRDQSVVRTMLHLGVLDYLIKPFTFERLRDALIRYKNRELALAQGRVSQSELDLVYIAADGFSLPRGLNPDTLGAVREAIKRFDGAASANEVANAAFVARVTARRYLEYLTTLQQVECLSEADGPGRPQKTYRWLGMDDR
jgi:response regulator of citrate/malate metabolism